MKFKETFNCMNNQHLSVLVLDYIPSENKRISFPVKTVQPKSQLPMFSLPATVFHAIWKHLLYCFLWEDIKFQL